MTQQALTSAMITPCEWEQICSALGLEATSTAAQVVERTQRQHLEPDAREHAASSAGARRADAWRPRRRCGI